MRQLVEKLPTEAEAAAGVGVKVETGHDGDDGKGAENRRAPRDEVALPTRMFVKDNQRGGDVLLVNISPYGFMVREYGATPKGAIVRLALPRLGQVSAQVMWSLGGRVGAQFIKPIDSYAYTAMLNATKAKRQRWPMG